ncbi:hypothetical protein CVU75_02930 [Candidatus Dependentiae bacterium HGW-Dependentiae-1]|nr:MAG: hypothetical protein CVU75_02930 [Candidatus Dependentiae bacterium HGW-Dependentiae-1]
MKRGLFTARWYFGGVFLSFCVLSAMQDEPANAQCASVVRSRKRDSSGELAPESSKKTAASSLASLEHAPRISDSSVFELSVDTVLSTDGTLAESSNVPDGSGQLSLQRSAVCMSWMKKGCCMLRQRMQRSTPRALLRVDTSGVTDSPGPSLARCAQDFCKRFWDFAAHAGTEVLSVLEEDSAPREKDALDDSSGDEQ